MKEANSRSFLQWTSWSPNVTTISTVAASLTAMLWNPETVGNKAMILDFYSTSPWYCRYSSSLHSRWADAFCLLLLIRCICCTFARRFVRSLFHYFFIHLVHFFASFVSLSLPPVHISFFLVRHFFVLFVFRFYLRPFSSSSSIFLFVVSVTFTVTSPFVVVPRKRSCSNIHTDSHISSPHNSMEHSPPWEVDSHSASQEIPRSL